MKTPLCLLTLTLLSSFGQKEKKTDTNMYNFNSGKHKCTSSSTESETFKCMQDTDHAVKHTSSSMNKTTQGPFDEVLNEI